MRSFLALASGLAGVLLTLDAAAFCRATTCNPLKEYCPADQRGCLVTGIPLHWPGRCVSYGIQAQGSPQLGITAEQLRDVVVQAFAAWHEADCGDGQVPAIDSRINEDFVWCNERNYNTLAPNANVWMFQDEDWPYDRQDNAIALTTTSYVKSTGEIYDADVELNSRDVQFTLSDDDPVVDLLSTITHEAGHFFGLGHTNVPGATMVRAYAGLEARSLAPDDQAGICAIYPPSSGTTARCDYEPRHGFSTVCEEPALGGAGLSCGFAPTGARARAGLAGSVLLGGVFWLGLRRRRR